jgi:methylenetetrahydrofolate dehydrogenase (NADP+)/methenyltetrahydrofolate cyclohydrolase
MRILDGKATATALRQALRVEVENRLARGLRPPHLAAILVGTDPASETYVASKVAQCQEVGFGSTLVRLPEGVSEAELLAEIERLNETPEVDGILVQLPLPGHIEEAKVLERVLPEKDVDGFHPENMGKLAKGLPCLQPATPAGVLLLLAHYGIQTAGLHAVVVGRSHNVGLPISLLLGQNHTPGNCTVTLCHSKTRDLRLFTSQADLVVVAAGKQHLLSKADFKTGAVVVDVGIHRVVSSAHARGFYLTGDVNPAGLADHLGGFTPVPGGVGPMTIAALLQNTLKACQLRTTV